MRERVWACEPQSKFSPCGEHLSRGLTRLRALLGCSLSRTSATFRWLTAARLLIERHRIIATRNLRPAFEPVRHSYSSLDRGSKICGCVSTKVSPGILTSTLCCPLTSNFDELSLLNSRIVEISFVFTLDVAWQHQFFYFRSSSLVDRWV